MRNIYDIFEERKFDVFYIEHFSFNDLDEIDMVMENIEKYIINDEYVVMEGFKDVMRKKVSSGIANANKVIDIMKRFITDVLIKFNTKYEPVKKYIEKIGKQKIINKLEGKKVRMQKYNKIDQVLKLSNGWIDIQIQKMSEGGRNVDQIKSGNYSTKVYLADEDDIIDGPLEKGDINILLDYVYRYKEVVDFYKNKINKCENVMKNSDLDEKKMRPIINEFRNGMFKCLSLVNKALLTLAKLIHNVMKDEDE